MSSKGIDDFLLGIAEATNALISSNLKEGVRIALRTLQDNLEVTLVSVFVVHVSEEGEPLASMEEFYDIDNDLERAKRNQDIPFTKFDQLYDSLVDGRSYEVVFSEAKGPLRQHFNGNGTKSLAIFPIFVNGQLWGALSLSDMEVERKWSISEKSLLLSLANSIGAAHEREQLQTSLDEKVKQRTAELEESKLRFQLAIEGTKNGIWDWQPQQNKIFWSENMYRNLGYKKEELPDLIEGFYDLIHPNEKEEARRRFDAYLNDKVPYEMEFRLLKKNGKYHWFKSTCKAVWDDRGEVIRVVGCHEDIHKRKVYTELLAEQEEKFRAVVRDDPNALFLVNASGKILLHSNRSIELFGYTAEEFKAMKLEELLPSDKREEHNRLMRSYFENPYTMTIGGDMNVKGRKRNGLLFWAEIGLSPVNIEGETLVMAVVVDVSERLEAEAKLKESYRQINNLITNLPGIVYQCRNDRDWTMDYISPACERITGYKQEDFYGIPSNVSYSELIVPDERDEVWEQVQESLSRKSPFRVTYRIRDKSGAPKWIWEQGVGVYGEEGEVQGLEGCIFDITPLIRNQERINQAIYAAENRERRKIATDLHDGVQQILGASSLNLKFLEDEVHKLSVKGRSHYKKSLKYLKQGIKESRSIAHQLMPKEIEQLGISKAIEQLFQELKADVGIEISYYNDLNGRLNADVELGLYRVVQESFNNIVKHSKAKKVSVQLISNEKEVQMMIEDNGVGFDKNKIDLYKEGFGLNGMKNRIVSLSGQLTLDSRPGRGTCIVVWLPRKANRNGSAN